MDNVQREPESHEVRRCEPHAPCEEVLARERAIATARALGYPPDHPALQRLAFTADRIGEDHGLDPEGHDHAEPVPMHLTLREWAERIAQRHGEVGP